MGFRTVPGLSYQPHFSQLELSYSPVTDRTENVSSIIACSLVAGGRTCPRSCSLATAAVLSPALYSCYLTMCLHVTILCLVTET
jgi:hypothetical protein